MEIIIATIEEDVHSAGIRKTGKLDILRIRRA